jgi:DNA-binding transcriptional MocR family regulator
MLNGSYHSTKRQEKLSVQVADQIQGLILANHSTPGDRLPTERELCDRFQVSRAVGLMHVTLPEGSLPHMECYRRGEMTVYEAPPASQWLGLDHVTTSHYATPESEDVKKFCQLANEATEVSEFSAKVSAMKPGEILEL